MFTLKGKLWILGIVSILILVLVVSILTIVVDPTYKSLGETYENQGKLDEVTWDMEVEDLSVIQFSKEYKVKWLGISDDSVILTTSDMAYHEEPTDVKFYISEDIDSLTYTSVIPPFSDFKSIKVVSIPAELSQNISNDYVKTFSEDFPTITDSEFGEIISNADSK